MPSHSKNFFFIYLTTIVAAIIPIQTQTTTPPKLKSTITTTTSVSSYDICTYGSANVNISSNQFIYSPIYQRYAAGMLNNQFGVYIAYGYNNVTSTSLWTAQQSSKPEGAYFAAQADRNLVVYTSSGNVLWTTNTYSFESQAVYCLKMLDNGKLVWMYSQNLIIWQTT